MIIYVKGPDSFLAAQAIRQISSKYLEKNPEGLERIEIDETTPNPNWIDLQTVPLFATSRLVLIRRAGLLDKNAQAQLGVTLKQLPDSTVAVVWDGKAPAKGSELEEVLETATKLIEADPIASARLPLWIQKQAKTMAFDVDRATISNLIEELVMRLVGG